MNLICRGRRIEDKRDEKEEEEGIGFFAMVGNKETEKIIRGGRVTERGKGKKIDSNLSYPFSFPSHFFVFVSLFLYLYIITFVFLFLCLFLFLCFLPNFSSPSSSFFFIIFLSSLAFSNLNFLLSSSSSSTSTIFFLSYITLVSLRFYSFIIPSFVLFFLKFCTHCFNVSYRSLFTVYRSLCTLYAGLLSPSPTRYCCCT